MFNKILDKYSSIAIIGLDKNSGKTTTLNSIIRAYDLDKTLSLTSIGRDGEGTDLVTSTSKPNIYVRKGTVIATARYCLGQSDITKEILEKSNINTAIGEIIIARALSDGFVELAGPSFNKELIYIIERLKQYSDKIIIDGALSRRSFASPAVADATIISTGAVIDRTLAGLVKKTVHYYKLLKVKQLENVEVLKILKRQEELAVFLDDDLNIKVLNIETALSSHDKILAQIDNNTRYIMLRGAITDRIVDRLIDQYKKHANVYFVVEDGTKLFIKEDKLDKLERKKIKLRVLDDINIVAMTVNPNSPLSYRLDSDEIINALKKDIKGIEIVNVKELDPNEISR